MIALAWMALLLVSVPLALYRGYIFLCMWDWFIAPAFNLQSISVWTAIGIMLLVSMLHVPKFDDTKQTKTAEFLKAFGTMVQAMVMATMTWGFAFIVHLIAG